jgi:hypothetical protein
MVKKLTNKLNAVLANIDNGQYQDAYNQLTNDVLGKANGCVETGTPDKSDWIVNCLDQNQIYPFLFEAINYFTPII